MSNAIPFSQSHNWEFQWVIGVTLFLTLFKIVDELINSYAVHFLETLSILALRWVNNIKIQNAKIKKNVSIF